MGSGLSVMPSDPQFWIAAGKIAWINILLASGSAVVIALACRSLPPRERKAAILLGAGAAALLPMLTGFAAQALALSFLKLIGGIALLWIAIELVVTGGGHKDKPVANVWRAVRIVVIAAVAVSLGSSAATAAASGVDALLIALGVLVSFALIAGGAILLTGLFMRLPILVWPGAALIGWIAGAIISKDPAVAGSIDLFVAAAAGALIVVVAAERLIYLREAHNAPPAAAPRLPGPRDIHRYRL